MQISTESSSSVHETGNEQLIEAKGGMPQIPVITAQTQTIKKKPKLISVGYDMNVQLFSVSHSIW